VGVSSFRIFEYPALLAKLRSRASVSSCRAIMVNIFAKPFAETNVLIGFEDGQAASSGTYRASRARQAIQSCAYIFNGTV
jgi:hypothetical protein